MKKFAARGLALLACVCVAVAILSSCMAATEAKTLSFSDASGSGSIVSTVFIDIGDDNTGTYAKDPERMAIHLQSVVDELTQTEGIYTVSYGGSEVSGNVTTHRINMSYSFTDINDYNVKTMRLFYSVPISTRNSVDGMGNEYHFADWSLSDNGDGTYDATFTQSGHAFAAMNLWAYRYLMENDIPDAWDNTGDGQAAQFHPVGSDLSQTIVTSRDSTVTLTVGDTTETLKAYDGGAVQTVTLTGKVSGTPVTVDYGVTDESIIAEKADEPAPDDGGEPAANIQPYITAGIAAVMLAAVVITAIATRKKGGNGNA